MNEEKVESIISEINTKFENVKEINELQLLKSEYLGKKGIITEMQSGIKEAADKKSYGMMVNKVRTTFNDLYEEKLKELNELELNRKLESEKIDISLPSTKINIGGSNILEKIIEEVKTYEKGLAKSRKGFVSKLILYSPSFWVLAKLSFLKYCS